jgi:hypothetical protein
VGQKPKVGGDIWPGTARPASSFLLVIRRVRAATHQGAPMPVLVDDRPRPATERPPEVTVRVVTEDRAGTRRRLPRLGAIFTTLVALIVAVALILVVGVVTGFLHLGNPFATSSVDRSPPAVLKQLTNLSSYRAAQGTYQQTIDVEDDVSILPSFIAGERTIFIAQGSVDANIDFSALGGSAVQMRGDHAVTVTLPEPTLGRAVIDTKNSRVASHDRGLVNRVVSVFSDNPNGEQRFFELAQKKLGAAAQHSHLVARAETNTTRMLRGLLGRLAFTDVQISFAPAAR